MYPRRATHQEPGFECKGHLQCGPGLQAAEPACPDLGSRPRPSQVRHAQTAVRLQLMPWPFLVRLEPGHQDRSFGHSRSGRLRGRLLSLRRCPRLSAVRPANARMRPQCAGATTLAAGHLVRLTTIGPAVVIAEPERVRRASHCPMRLPLPSERITARGAVSRCRLHDTARRLPSPVTR